MLISSHTNKTQLDADNQLQLDYLLWVIERLETPTADEQTSANTSLVPPPSIRSNAVLSTEELSMLAQLYQSY
ncbi:hypothetical protein [Shewanella pealeana]|nr:hypothetical protein [Shewanella pealeana]